jgi:hypothetical protein
MEGRTKKNGPTQLENRLGFSWRTNGIQSFIGWFPFLSFSIGWTVFILVQKKENTKKKKTYEGNMLNPSKQRGERKN